MQQALVTSTAPGAGLTDPVMDAQAIFRQVMNALAEPGSVRPLDPDLLAALQPPAPLTPATAAMLLALADFETPVWLDPALSTASVTAYLRFHAGCPLVTEPSKASFAVIADGATLDRLDGFALGSLEYPDRSTTVIVQVMSLTHGPAWSLSGPGIDGIRTAHVLPLHHDLVASLQANHALFPCGVDLLLTDGTSVLGLPRSTDITEA